MNKELKDKIYDIPPLILSGIKDNIKKYPNNIDGIKRAKNLLTGKVNYNQLKRILHDMKNCLKNNEIDKYMLAGGKPFETWGWTILNTDRDVIEYNKKTKKNANSIGGIIGRKNPYNKNHRKKINFNTPPNALISNSETYTSNLKLGKLFEEIIEKLKK